MSLSGAIDENTDFSRIIGRLEGTALELDCRRGTRISSAGVHRGTGLFSAIRSRGVLVKLHRCSPVVVDRLNELRNFACGAIIESIELLFLCESCTKTWGVNAPMRDLARSGGKRMLKPVCQGCAKPLVFDDFEHERFRFLAWAPGVSSTGFPATETRSRFPRLDRRDPHLGLAGCAEIARRPSHGAGRDGQRLPAVGAGSLAPADPLFALVDVPGEERRQKQERRHRDEMHQGQERRGDSDSPPHGQGPQGAPQALGAGPMLDLQHPSGPSSSQADELNSHSADPPTVRS